MLRQRPFLVETLTAIGLLGGADCVALSRFRAEHGQSHSGVGPVRIGFDILFGYTGLLSFGQSAFYGTGGFVAAYLLTRTGFPYVVLALIIGMVAAGAVGYLVGLIALRRTGIYFAMITVAIAEVFYFVEFNPLSEWTGGENGLPGVPTPTLNLGFASLHFTTGWSLYQFIAVCYFVGIVIGLRIVRSPVGAILRAIRDNPLRVAALRPQHPRLQARGFRDRCSLCRLCRRAARRDAGFHAAGRLHVRDVRATGDADRNRWYRHAVRSAARRCGVVVSAGFSAGAHWDSARPGNSSLVSSSCCWCASCGTA